MTTTLPKVSIRKGREFQIRRGHPWLFSGGISQAPNNLPAGSAVDLVDTDGRFVARGYYNPGCDIAVRVVTLDQSESLDRKLLEKRIDQAVNLREMFLDPAATNVFRLINAEGDFLPGFIVDSYAGVLVVQSHTAGSDVLLPDFLAALEYKLTPKAVIVRNDVSARKREGLAIQAPTIVAGECPSELTVRENSLAFMVDPLKGQKTGFFTDQRDKRQSLIKYAAHAGPTTTMLNCFSYTCGFSVYAASANQQMRTVNIDQSERALEQGKANLELNEIDPGNHEFVAADAFKWLESQRDGGTKYGIVILDPPAFAKTHKDKGKALKGYQRITRLGLSVVEPGGLIVVSSCSGAVSHEEFQMSVRAAVAESGRRMQILESHANGADHPVSIAAPEGGYLKVLFCRVA